MNANEPMDPGVPNSGAPTGLDPVTVKPDPARWVALAALLVAGWAAPEDAEVDAETLRILDLLLAELPIKRAAALAAQITGARKNLLYQLALERKGE